MMTRKKLKKRAWCKRVALITVFIAVICVDIFSQENLQIVKEGKGFNYQLYQKAFSDSNR